MDFKTQLTEVNSLPTEKMQPLRWSLICFLCCQMNINLFKESLRKLTAELGGPPVNANAFLQARHGIDGNGVTHALTVPSNVTPTRVSDAGLVVRHPIHLQGKRMGFIFQDNFVLVILYVYTQPLQRYPHFSLFFTT